MSEETEQSRTIEYVEPEDGRLLVYANNHMIAVTAYDIRVLFGEVVGVTDEKIEIEQRVQVTMTWLQAKYLMENLLQRIAAFEKLNGEIKLPTIP